MVAQTQLITDVVAVEFVYEAFLRIWYYSAHLHPLCDSERFNQVFSVALLAL